MPPLTERRISLLLFAAALLLYLPGLWWGLPYATAANRIRPWGSDELAPLGFGELYSVSLHPRPKFDPRYPLFHHVIQALAAGPYVLYLWLTGQISHFTPEYPYGLLDPVGALAVLTVLGRLPSLFMAAGVVVVAFRTAAILWDRRTGVLAGVAVLLIYPMFYYARTSNVDMPALFWTSLGLAVCAACLRDGITVRRAVWLGLLAALATATKDASYAAFAALVPMLAWWHARDARRPGTGWPERWKAPLLGLVALVGVYVVASGLAIHPGRFVIHLRFIVHGSPWSPLRKAYGSTPTTLAGYVGVVRDTLAYLAEALGEPMLALALAGLVACAARRSRTAAFALPALGTLLGVILPVRFLEFRFVLVMAYSLALFAAYAVASSLRSPSPLLRRSGQIGFVIACGWLLLLGADLTYQMLNDSRYEAARWFGRVARPGDRVTFTDGAYKLPHLALGIVAVGLPPGPRAARVLERDRPEFVTVIPVLRLETHREHLLSEEVYRALRDGTLGYAQVLAIQTPPLFSRRPIPIVNPPVKVFVWKDLLARLDPSTRRIELDH